MAADTLLIRQARFALMRDESGDFAEDVDIVIEGGRIAEIEAVEPSTHGARVVARARVDPGYRDRLLGDGNAAVVELDLDPGVNVLTALENTPQVHNV
ncbi:MAG: nitrile hydratase subunit alpha, partial [Candidatus Nanopelagicales bacterium]